MTFESVASCANTFFLFFAGVAPPNPSLFASFFFGLFTAGLVVIFANGGSFIFPYVRALIARRAASSPEAVDSEGARRDAAHERLLFAAFKFLTAFDALAGRGAKLADAAASGRRILGPAFRDSMRVLELRGDELQSGKRDNARNTEQE